MNADAGSSKPNTYRATYRAANFCFYCKLGPQDHIGPDMECRSEPAQTRLNMLGALRTIYEDIPTRPNMTEAGRVALMAETARAAIDTIIFPDPPREPQLETALGQWLNDFGTNNELSQRSRILLGRPAVEPMADDNSVAERASFEWWMFNSVAVGTDIQAMLWMAWRAGAIWTRARTEPRLKPTPADAVIAEAVRFLRAFNGAHETEAIEIEALQRNLHVRNQQIDGFERQLGIDHAGAERTVDREIARLLNTLHQSGYTDCGGALWKPPLGKNPLPELDRLRDLINQAGQHWLNLQQEHFLDLTRKTPIQWQGGIDAAMEAACKEIRRLDNIRKVATEYVDAREPLGDHAFEKYDALYHTIYPPKTIAQRLDEDEPDAEKLCQSVADEPIQQTSLPNERQVFERWVAKGGMQTLEELEGMRIGDTYRSITIANMWVGWKGRLSFLN